MSDFIPFNMTVFRGDGRSRHFRAWNIAGTPIDVSTWKLFHTAKKRLEDSDDAAEIANDSDNDPTAFTFYDSGTGTVDSFSVNYLPADTNTMNPRDYFQDLQIIDGSGPPRTYAFGILTIPADVTRRVTT